LLTSASVWEEVAFGEAEIAEPSSPPEVPFLDAAYSRQLSKQCVAVYLIERAKYGTANIVRTIGEKPQIIAGLAPFLSANPSSKVDRNSQKITMAK
jgi:hypothetical protein